MALIWELLMPLSPHLNLLLPFGALVCGVCVLLARRHRKRPVAVKTDSEVQTCCDCGGPESRLRFGLWEGSGGGGGI